MVPIVDPSGGLELVSQYLGSSGKKGAFRSRLNYCHTIKPTNLPIQQQDRQTDGGEKTHIALTISPMRREP
jgi:hypothetical protein